MLSKKCTCIGKLYSFAKLVHASNALSEQVYKECGATEYVIRALFSSLDSYNSLNSFILVCKSPPMSTIGLVITALTPVFTAASLICSGIKY